MRPQTSSRAVSLVAAALVALVTIAVYWPVLGHDHVWWDDPENLFANPDFNPPRIGSLAKYWTSDTWGLYVPLVYTAWFGLALIAWRTGPHGQLDPRIFHAANLAVHVMCALVVFALLRCLLSCCWKPEGPGSPSEPRRQSPDPQSISLAAAMGATLFAVHPVQVESVAWISGMKDLLCGLFSATALWLYVNHAMIDVNDPRQAARRMALYLLSTAAFAAALLAKPVAVAVPLVALVLDRGLIRRPLGSAIGSLIPWIALTLPIMYITRAAQPIPSVYAMSPWPRRPIVAGDSLAFYVRQTAFPARLAMDYGRSPAVVAAHRLAWLAWLVPLGVGAALWLLRRRARPVVLGAMVYFIPLVPVLGFIPFGAQEYSSVADHYLYLPLFGLALAAAWGASRLPARVALGVGIPVLAILAMRSGFQVGHWRDTRTLFSHNLRINPDSWTSHINLAADALLRGQPIVAEHHSREALELRPNDGQIYLNLALALHQQQRISEAVDAVDAAIGIFERALGQDPDQPDVKDHLGRARRMRRAATQRSMP